MGCLIWLQGGYISPLQLLDYLTRSINREKDMWREKANAGSAHGRKGNCDQVTFFINLPLIRVSVHLGSSREVHWWRRGQCRLPGETQWHPRYYKPDTTSFFVTHLFPSLRQCPLNCPAGPKGPQGLQGVKVRSWQFPWRNKHRFSSINDCVA